MPEDASYVIQTGADARDRLELIARLFWPTTETFLTRNDAFSGGRFLDVGCGIGDVTCRLGAAGAQSLGIDVNAEVIDLATRRASSLGAPASFRVDGTAELGTDDLRDLDVVYSRCLLTHQSDPAAALAGMVAAARSGGLILVEDVEVAAVWSSPPNDALVRHVELYVERRPRPRRTTRRRSHSPNARRARRHRHVRRRRATGAPHPADLVRTHARWKRSRVPSSIRVWPPPTRSPTWSRARRVRRHPASSPRSPASSR